MSRFSLTMVLFRVKSGYGYIDIYSTANKHSSQEMAIIRKIAVDSKGSTLIFHSRFMTSKTSLVPCPNCRKRFILIVQSTIFVVIPMKPIMSNAMALPFLQHSFSPHSKLSYHKPLIESRNTFKSWLLGGKLQSPLEVKSTKVHNRPNPSP